MNDTLTPAAAAAARMEFSAYMRAMATRRGGGEMREEPVSLVQQAALCWAFDSRKHIVIAAPPALGKSTVARHFVAWQLGRNPLLRVVVCSQDMDKISTGIVSACRNIIQDPKYCGVFPEVRPDIETERKLQSKATGSNVSARGFQAGQFFLLNSGNDPDPAMAAVAFETEALNRRVDLALFDDVETDATARTQEGRQKVADTLDRKWINGRLVDFDAKGIAVVLSNCWHEDDLIHRLRDNEEFCQVWIYVNDDMTALTIECHGFDADFLDGIPGVERVDESTWECPFPQESVVYSQEALNIKSAASPNFDCIYKFRAASDKDRMFPSWGRRRRHEGDVADAHGMKRTPEGLPDFRGQSRFQFAWGIDFAHSSRKGNCMALFSLDRSGVYRPVEWHFFDRMTVGLIVDTIESARARGAYPATVRPEAVAIQGAMIEEIRIYARRVKVPWVERIEHHVTDAGKMNPEVGLPSIESMIALGNFEWPDGQRNCPVTGDSWQRAESQFATCPRFPQKGKTPDGPMAAWFATRGLRERANFATPQSSKFIPLGAPRRYEP